MDYISVGIQYTDSRRTILGAQFRVKGCQMIRLLLISFTLMISLPNFVYAEEPPSIASINKSIDEVNAKLQEMSRMKEGGSQMLQHARYECGILSETLDNIAERVGAYVELQHPAGLFREAGSAVAKARYSDNIAEFDNSMLISISKFDEAKASLASILEAVAAEIARRQAVAEENARREAEYNKEVERRAAIKAQRKKIHNHWQKIRAVRGGGPGSQSPYEIVDELRQTLLSTEEIVREYYPYCIDAADYYNYSANHVMYALQATDWGGFDGNLEKAVQYSNSATQALEACDK